MHEKMTDDKLTNDIRDAVVSELKKADPTPEEGISAMVNAILEILHALAQLLEEDPKFFIKHILKQVLKQL